MRPEILFRPVRSYECSQVITLHRAVFSPEQLVYTIYSAPHAEHYLANLLAFPKLQREHILCGAWAGDNLIGYIHFQALPESWHLDYVAVLSNYQGQGIGQMMWTAGIEMGQQLGYNRISLDVARENQPALNWYRRQGLKIIQTVWMYEKDLESAAASHETEEVRLLDWEQAEAWQLTYGFSQFRLAYQGQVWLIGRLGECYFRVKEKIPSTLEGILSKIDPTRRLLVLSSAPLQDLDLNEVEISFRMQGDIAL